MEGNHSLAYFQLSDYGPMGILLNACETTKKEISIFDVPTKYIVHLNVDQEKTLRTGKLVFVLAQASDRTEFSRTAFTLKK
jgi:hypothetical protein